jgi:hypothetical protein
MLTPFVGILTNIYQKIKSEDLSTSKYDSIEDFVARSESFDI